MNGFRRITLAQDSRREWKRRAEEAVKIIEEMKKEYDILLKKMLRCDRLARRPYRPLVSRKKLLSIMDGKESS
jgi:hypothetical protein